MSIASQVRAARAARKARNVHAAVTQHTFDSAPSAHTTTRARGRKVQRQSVFGFNGGKIHHNARDK